MRRRYYLMRYFLLIHIIGFSVFLFPSIIEAQKKLDPDDQWHPKGPESEHSGHQKEKSKHEKDAFLMNKSKEIQKYSGKQVKIHENENKSKIPAQYEGKQKQIGDDKRMSKSLERSNNENLWQGNTKDKTKNQHVKLSRKVSQHEGKRKQVGDDKRMSKALERSNNENLWQGNTKDKTKNQHVKLSRKASQHEGKRKQVGDDKRISKALDRSNNENLWQGNTKGKTENQQLEHHIKLSRKASQHEGKRKQVGDDKRISKALERSNNENLWQGNTKGKTENQQLGHHIKLSKEISQHEGKRKQVGDDKRISKALERSNNENLWQGNAKISKNVITSQSTAKQKSIQSHQFDGTTNNYKIKILWRSIFAKNSDNRNIKTPPTPPVRDKNESTIWFE